MKKILAVSLCLLALLAVPGCQRDASPAQADSPLPPLDIPVDAKLVSLFFDDAFMNQHEVAFPILQQYGFPATFGAITGSLGKGYGLWEYMGEKELRELARGGMDIASHTVSHVSLSSNLTDKQLQREIVDSKKALEKMGLKVTTMVYPYYEWDDRAIAAVKEAGYTCARGGWAYEKYVTNTIDPNARYHVFSWQITNQDMDTFKLYLKEAGPVTLVGLTYHFISDEGPAATSTPLANFKAQMAYLKDAGFTVVLLPRLFIK